MDDCIHHKCFFFYIGISRQKSKSKNSTIKVEYDRKDERIPIKHFYALRKVNKFYCFLYLLFGLVANHKSIINFAYFYLHQKPTEA